MEEKKNKENLLENKKTQRKFVGEKKKNTKAPKIGGVIPFDLSDTTASQNQARRTQRLSRMDPTKVQKICWKKKKKKKNKKYYCKKKEQRKFVGEKKIQRKFVRRKKKQRNAHKIGGAIPFDLSYTTASQNFSESSS